MLMHLSIHFEGEYVERILVSGLHFLEGAPFL